MKKQDAGYGIQDAKPVAVFRSSHPASSIPHPVLKRVRWRCRRGLLELDIVLGRFIEQHYAELNAAQQIAFDALLDMPDTTLWDMIAGRNFTSVSDEQGEVLALLQAV